MAIDYETQRLINNLTMSIIEVFDINIPITNIDEIVKKIGGEVKVSSSLSEYSDGLIRKTQGDEFEIVVSEYQPPNRRNFTVAHELGHLFLHMGYMIDEKRWEKQKDIYYRKGNSQEEYEANEFAAALLMPKDEYKRIMDKYTDGDTVDTSKIAKEFNVSTNAASNRGKWLGYLQW